MRIIGGKWRGKSLLGPTDRVTRPTSDRHKESLFNVLDHVVCWNGVSVLDAFSGTGALGLEALSRGAHHVTFIEKHRPALQILGKNTKIAPPEATTTYPINFATFHSTHPFDVIFLDPPYYDNTAVQALEMTSKSRYSHHNTRIILEANPKHIPRTPEGLICIKEKKYSHTALLFYAPIGRM